MSTKESREISKWELSLKSRLNQSWHEPEAHRVEALQTHLYFDYLDPLYPIFT